jgi:hypothetical protein
MGTCSGADESGDDGVRPVAARRSSLRKRVGNSSEKLQIEDTPKSRMREHAEYQHNQH